MKIPLANPSRELSYLKNFDTNFLEKLKNGIYIGGEDVKNLEENLAKFLNKKYCVSLNSGTDALLFSLIASGVRQGDKVIVPSFTFFATVEVVMHLGAIPVFVDIDPEYFTINLNDLRSKLDKSIKAIIPVHLFGNNSEIDSIKKLCKEYEIKIIEDVAQAFGSETKSGSKLGSVGHFGAFSFFPSKTLGGIGDGGCIVTDSDESYNLFLKLRNHGINTNLEHDTIGGNSRLDSLNAFVLNEKLKIFKDIQNSRAKFYEFYLNSLSNISWIKLPKIKHDKILLNYFSIQVPQQYRDELKIYLNEHGIGAGIYYKKPIHLQQVVVEKYEKTYLENTENTSKSILSLPFFAFPKDNELEYILNIIKKFK